MKKVNNIWDEYIKIEEIGLNLFSKVYRAKNNLSDNYVLIKEIKKENINENNILKVIETMKKLNNSVLLIDSIETKDYYYLISELCFLSLEKYLNMRENPLTIHEIRETLLELNKIFKEMNEKNIIHGNLKPSNILLSLNKSNINKMNFKISDFRINELRDIKKMNLNNFQITMSPEVLKGEKYLISTKSDIWSLGIIIYYMLFKEFPYTINNKNNAQEIEIEINNKLKQIYEVKLNDLMNKMLVININKRISWEEYFQYHFFKNNIIEKIIESNQINIPKFNLKCEIHIDDLIGYCSVCKCNICKICFEEHSSKYHKVFLFSEIGFSEDEIKQIDDITKQINNNIQKLENIKDKINKLINDVKSINKNNDIYKNDKDNNFKNYIFECLKFINNKFEFENIQIDLPIIYKWELR